MYECGYDILFEIQLLASAKKKNCVLLIDTDNEPGFGIMNNMARQQVSTLVGNYYCLLKVHELVVEMITFLLEVIPVSRPYGLSP